MRIDIVIRNSSLDSGGAAGGAGNIAEQSCQRRCVHSRVPDLVPGIKVPVVHHIPSPGASTAKEKGSAGPAQERRDSGTLDEISLIGRRPGSRPKAET